MEKCKKRKPVLNAYYVQYSYSASVMDIFNLVPMIPSFPDEKLMPRKMEFLVPKMAVAGPKPRVSLDLGLHSQAERWRHLRETRVAWTGCSKPPEEFHSPQAGLCAHS